MKVREPINIAIAESSVIVRSGLLTIIRRMPDVKIMSTEINSMEALQHNMKGCHLDIIFVNPYFEGFFNIKEFKTHFPNASVKFVAILSAVSDANLIKDYDACIKLYDTQDEIFEKISNLMDIDDDTVEEEQEVLSQREKEIICYVVKGLTNKEIAEKLFISVHTVITHRRNISRKLQIHSSAGLTIYAIVNKLVELKEIKDIKD